MANRDVKNLVESWLSSDLSHYQGWGWIGSLVASKDGSRVDSRMFLGEPAILKSISVSAHNIEKEVNGGMRNFG